MKETKKEWGKTVVNIIKAVFVIYIIVVTPTVFFGEQTGVLITFFLLLLWMFYRGNEKYHQEREEYLKELLVREGMDENLIDHGLDAVEKRFFLEFLSFFSPVLAIFF